MTLPIIKLPCKTNKLETALHALCDGEGLWDATVDVCVRPVIYPNGVRRDNGEYILELRRG